MIDRNVKCWQSWICSVSRRDPCRSCLNSPVDHFLFFAHVLYMNYRKQCTLNVHLHSFLSRFTKLCRTISNQDVERPNILSAHTLCIYLFASELKQLTSLCNNQNKVFATFMCTQLTGDSRHAQSLVGERRSERHQLRILQRAILIHVLFGGERTECHICKFYKFQVRSRLCSVE